MQRKKVDVTELARRVPRNASFRKLAIRCCRTCKSCPHGPYWYAQARVQGRNRSFYIGSDARMAALRAEWTRVAPELFGEDDQQKPTQSDEVST